MGVLFFVFVLVEWFGEGGFEAIAGASLAGAEGRTGVALIDAIRVSEAASFWRASLTSVCHFVRS